MKTRTLFVSVPAVVLLATIAGPARADDAATVGFAVTGGLSGLGVDVGGRITDYLGVRGTFSNISISHNGQYGTSAAWNATLKLQQTGLLLDIYPFAGGFHLSAGAVKDGNKISLFAQPNSNGTFTFNGNSYLASYIAAASSSVDWGKTVPYAGIGFGNLTDSKGLHFTADAGVLFSGKPTATMNVNCSAAGASAGICGALQTAVAADQVKLQNDVNKVSVWPVVRLGIGWAF